MKHLKIGTYELWAIGIILAATMPRIIILIGQGPTKYNRYQPYYDVVKADPATAYVFAANNLPTNVQYSSSISPVQKFPGRQFRALRIDGYVIYVPV